MRVHWLQHVSFENLGSIEEWALKQQHTLSSTRVFAGDLLPKIDELDTLIIMGGPMSVHDEERYPWLIEEKRLIHAAVEAGKRLLGICLGAQLIAQVLGANVYKNPEKEIGWFPIDKNPNDVSSDLLDHMLDQAIVFHWHGETFDIPMGARLLAQSDGCRHQAFAYDKNILALQFHLEITETGVDQLIENCGNEIIPAPYIQTGEEMRSGLHHCSQNQQLMNGILDKLIPVEL